MLSFCNVHLWAVSCLLVASAVQAEEPRGHNGFVLGGTFEAAQKHGLANGWKLAPLSDDLPGFWSVGETGLTFFVCGSTVTAINKQMDGDFEEFTALVFSMTIQLGKPTDTQILCLPSGMGAISTVDARFETDDGGTLVQL